VKTCFEVLIAREAQYKGELLGSPLYCGHELTPYINLPVSVAVSELRNVTISLTCSGVSCFPS